MRTLLLTALFGLTVCLVSAKHGSISDDLYDEDTRDDEFSMGDNLEGESETYLEELRRNPCYTKKCHRGETCILDDENRAKCQCVKDCNVYQGVPSEINVCSNHNVTYETECHLDQDHCRCKNDEEGCTAPGSKKIQLKYYGACRELTRCPEQELAQFPGRMRDWLFVVMEDMAARARIGEYADLLEQAEKDKHHAYAVIWKFCDLDSDPQDRFVSRRELQYTVRSLMAMEHCLVPFFDGCDSDDNRQISLTEWGTCLGLKDDEIVDKCKNIHKHKKN